MKKLATLGLIMILIGLVMIRKDDIITLVNKYIMPQKIVVAIDNKNEYYRDYDFLYVQRTDDFSPQNTQDILNIYSSLLLNLPENTSLEEIVYYLNENLLDYLIELDNNYATLLNFYLLYKLDLILDNEAYSIDLTKEEKISGNKIRESLKMVLECFDLKETIEEFINSNNQNQILITNELKENLI